MVYTWAVAIQYMSFVRAVMSVYIIFKVKNMLTGNGRRVTFFRYCADVTYLPDH